MPSVFQMDCAILRLFLMIDFLIRTVFAHKFHTRRERHNRRTSSGSACSPGTYLSNGNTPCTPFPAGSYSKGEMASNIVLLDVYASAQTVPPSHVPLQGLGIVYLWKGPRLRLAARQALTAITQARPLARLVLQEVCVPMTTSPNPRPALPVVTRRAETSYNVLYVLRDTLTI